jgi:hypothetical protein
MCNSTNTPATEPQIVTISPQTANLLADALRSFAQSVDAPELECDPRNVTELDLQRAITLASMATGPSEFIVLGAGIPLGNSESGMVAEP